MAKSINWLIIAIFLGVFLAWNPLAAWAQGQETFNAKCAMCHGQDGKGNGPMSSGFSPPPANFTSPSFWQGNAQQKITTTVENGHGSMPALSLTPSQIKTVIAYMEKTFKP